LRVLKTTIKLSDKMLLSFLNSLNLAVTNCIYYSYPPHTPPKKIPSTIKKHLRLLRLWLAMTNKVEVSLRVAKPRSNLMYSINPDPKLILGFNEMKGGGYIEIDLYRNFLF
jgi:hypothetical protein